MAHYAFVASCTTASGAVDSSCEDGNHYHPPTTLHTYLALYVLFFP
jgi:hypothetical protein